MPGTGHFVEGRKYESVVVVRNIKHIFPTASTDHNRPLQKVWDQANISNRPSKTLNWEP